jgi:hypothetical protein
MIQKRAHSLLSELHGLLANYGAEEFLEASHFSPELSAALEMLAKQTEGHQPQNGRNGESDTIDIRKAGNRKPVPPTAQEIAAILEHALYGESLSSILTLAKRLGINIAINSKDGKSRIIRRLSNGIASLPKTERARVLAEIKKKPGSQTQGWVDVLKNRR